MWRLLWLRQNSTVCDQPNGREMWRLNLPLTAFFALILVACDSKAATLSVTENATLTFGTLARPTSGTRTITISPTGGMSGSGELLYGSFQSGAYGIRSNGAAPPPTISIEITNIGSGSGYSVGSFTGEYDGTPIASFPAVGIPTPDGVTKILKLGATVTYDNSLAVGTFTPTFDIVVNYE